MNELEKAKLLSVASKLAKAEIEEVRSQLIEQINSIEIPQAINGRDGRSIADARIFDGQLVLQLSDGALITVGSVIGEQGLIGPVGAKGDKGDKGDTGESGPPGPRGDTGLQGLPGKDGERGPRGDQGPKGDTGAKGDKGDQGERGEQGPQGIAGERGEPGERGEQGPRGSDGTNGRDGAEGKTGERGPQGLPGRDGKDGKDGEVGPQGPKGEKGDKGDPGSDADVSQLEKKLDQFEQDVDRRISKIAFNAATGGGPAGSGEVLLHRLDDVDYNTVKTPTNGQALVYNSTLGKWQANTVSAGISNTFTTTVATRSIIPTANVTYDIGSSTKRYNDLWLANSTIYIGEAQLSASGTKLLVGGSPTVTNTYFRSVLANTNAYIAAVASSGGGGGGGDLDFGTFAAPSGFSLDLGSF